MAGRSRSPRARWRGLTVVVTAGPTREHLDDVRFLSNASTGRMGIELARAAARRGATVTLVLGPSALAPPRGVETVHVTSTDELLCATRAAVTGADLVFFAAAPSDFQPARRRRGKPPREGGAHTLALRPTPDVAARLGRGKGERVHVGFALEIVRGETRAREKMARKRFDAIVWNTPANLGSGGGGVRWIPAAGDAVALRAKGKPALARVLLDRAFALLDG